MFTPKLIVTDLDGTALNNNKEITTETIKAFERCRKKGIHIAIATDFVEKPYNPRIIMHRVQNVVMAYKNARSEAAATNEKNEC